jgi:hypothetical protein
MKEILIETNVGSCALVVRAEINVEEILKSMKSFGEFLIWHNAASATFAGGKKAEFKRDDSFSDKLGAKACESVVNALGKHGFTNVRCEASEKVQLDDKAKFVAYMLKLGLSSEAIEAGWETAQSKMQAKKPMEEIIS